MLALAITALAVSALVRRTGLLPNWLGHTAVLLSAALMVCGAGYLLLNNTLAQAAAAALPLLLIVVTGTGLTLGSTSR